MSIALLFLMAIFIIINGFAKSLIISIIGMILGVVAASYYGSLGGDLVSVGMMSIAVLVIGYHVIYALTGVKHV